MPLLPGFLETRGGDQLRVDAIDCVALINVNDVDQKTQRDFIVGNFKGLDIERPITGVYIREAVWYFQGTPQDIAALMIEAKRRNLIVQGGFSSESNSSDDDFPASLGLR